MLSILIPTYNYSIFNLVTELHQQAMEAEIEFEIIVIDDGSSTCKELNRPIEGLSFCKFIELSENVGRSRIRNLLADEAKYDYLIFLDCDAEIYNKNFVQRYLAFCKGITVVVGGRIYDEKNNHPDYRLTKIYGEKRESYSAAMKESRYKNKTFTTPNFLISKSIFKDIRFNENIKGYGHEDTIFGVMLHQKGIEVFFIDNPVVHVGLDKGVTFLKKTEDAISNLYVLYTEKTYPYLENDSKILSTFMKLKRFRLEYPIKWLFIIFKPVFVYQLLGKYPSLFILDFYRLGHLCKIATAK